MGANEHAAPRKLGTTSCLSQRHTVQRLKQQLLKFSFLSKPLILSTEFGLVEKSLGMMSGSGFKVSVVGHPDS